MKGAWEMLQACTVVLVGVLLQLCNYSQAFQLGATDGRPIAHIIASASRWVGTPWANRLLDVLPGPLTASFLSPFHFLLPYLFSPPIPNSLSFHTHYSVRIPPSVFQHSSNNMTMRQNPSCLYYSGSQISRSLGFISEKAMAPHSSTLAWKIPWMEEPGGLQSMGSLRVGHDWVTSLSLFTFMHWRRKWHPTPVFLPRESQGQRSLVGCHLWGRTESDTTEVT